jgi:hypothetical protein
MKIHADKKKWYRLEEEFIVWGLLEIDRQVG